MSEDTRVEVSHVPIRMINKSVPGSKYVVRKLEGGVEGVDETLIFLYNDYILNNGFRVAMPVDFERYCNVRDHESCPADIEIWVPVEDAQPALAVEANVRW